MEPDGSSPCSQKPTTGTYPEQDESSPYLPTFLQIHFNIMFPLTPRSSKRSFHFRFSDQKFVCIYHLFQPCYMPRPSHPSWFIILMIFGKVYKL
jgi:hypothetical protein